MRYWTLFALRLLATTGFMTTVVWWCVGQSHHAEGSVRVGRSRLAVLTDARSATVGWFPGTESEEWYKLVNAISVRKVRQTGHRDQRLPTQPVGILPGNSNRPSVVKVDHWLLCLTLLIATIATSVRWKKPAAELEKERTDE